MAVTLPRLIGFLLPLLLATLSADVNAQTLRLRVVGTAADRVTAEVGDIVSIEVFADLGDVESAGIAFYIGVPEKAFQIVDRGHPNQEGTQPFAPGLLFDGAQVASNLLLAEDIQPAAAIPGQQLEYGAIFGAGSSRKVTGSGVVATFALLCMAPVENAVIRIDDNSVRETKLVLTDGVSEKRFLTVQGVEISVVNRTGTAVAPVTWGRVKRDSAR